MRWTSRAVVAGALGIALLDGLQVVVLPWRPKHVGALGGVALYLTVAWSVWWDARWGYLLAAAIPVIPVSIVLLSLAGAPVPAQPDREMLVILGIQLCTAAAAGVHLRQPDRRGPDRTT